MKIEKLNDNQVRCILTKEDLVKRKIKLSEFVYGTEKARELFSDMLHMAEEQCGFESDDMPMIIEAIPTSQDNLVIIMTKVENPDELDMRFANFTPFDEDEDEDSQTPDKPPFSTMTLDLFGEEGKDAIKQFVERIKKVVGSEDFSESIDKKMAAIGIHTEKETRNEKVNTKVSFEFDTLEQLSKFAHIVNATFKGTSVLYKNSETGKYYLLLKLGRGTFENYRMVCSMACEYGKQSLRFSDSYYEEHFEKIIARNALTTMAELL